MLEILISSSVLILVLAVLRLVLRDKISARLQYALWLLVLVRLLVPVSFFHSPVSVAEAAKPVTEQAWSASQRVLYTWNTPGSAPAASAGLPTQLDEGGVINSGDVLLLRDALLLVWNLGMVVMAAWFLFVNLRFARRLKKDRMPYDSDSVLSVYVTGSVPSPCLFGLLRPSIYLTPRAAEDDAQARQIVTHELVHYRHGDMLWAFLRSVCLVVWWFNPLVWLAAALSRRDCELACDEGTIRALGEDARFDYGRTLVGMAAIGTKPSELLCGATTMTAGKKSLRARVARIADAPKMSAAVAVTVLLVAAVAVGCTFSGTAEKTAETPAPAAEVPVSASASDTENEAAMLNQYGPFITYFTAYLNHGVTAQDAAAWAQYVYFGSDEKRALDMRDYRPAAAAFVAEDQQLSDDLWAFRVGYQDFPGEEVYYVIQFCGEYDGRLYVFRNENSLPDALRGALSRLTLTADPGESIMADDQNYWEEVDREFASFLGAEDVELYISEYFDETLPGDDIFGPLTLADYVYGTDGWSFTYNSEPIANDPSATILVRDADGRELRIMDDADALMIREMDGSVTWVEYRDDPVDCADMIRHLLPWARGEFGRDDSYAPEPGDQVAAAVPAPAPPELPEGFVNDYVLEGDELDEAMAMLMSFASPEEVSVNSAFGDAAPADNPAKDFASFVSAHDWTVRYSPGPAANAPDASIILTNGAGWKLWIVSDLDYLELVLPEETFENNHPELHFYDGAGDGDYLRELWSWASSLAS